MLSQTLEAPNPRPSFLLPLPPLSSSPPPSPLPLARRQTWLLVLNRHRLRAVPAGNVDEYEQKAATSRGATAWQTNFIIIVNSSTGIEMWISNFLSKFHFGQKQNTNVSPLNSAHRAANLKFACYRLGCSKLIVWSARHGWGSNSVTQRVLGARVLIDSYNRN